MFARTILHRMRRGGHSTRGFLRLLLLALPIIASLIPSADRARACVGRDGSPPPWGRTKPNGIMVDQINLAHAIAKANGLQTPVVPPVSGSHKTVIILVENAANGAAFTSAFRSATLWSARLKQFDNYYNEVSRGMLRIVPAAETFGTANDGVIGPVTIPSLSSSTSDGDYAAEAVRAANPYINFASFDTNGDGKITATELHILIYQAGYETSYTGTSSSLRPRAWAHTSWQLSGIPGNVPILDSDNKIITSYCYCGSIFTSSMMATQGQMTHELGHDLGLPDLYDTDSTNSGGYSETIGWNCLMASGSWGGVTYGDGSSPSHIDAYYKNWLGWENQVTVTAPVNQARSLLAANGNNQSLRINVTGSNEFFIVENRQQTGYDAGLPGTQGGLVVYHCDGTILNGTGAVNNNPGSLGLAVEEADGDFSMTRQTGGLDRGQDTDYFRSGNRTSFNNTTTPNSNLKNGAASNVKIYGVGASGNSMSFYVGTVAPQLTAFSINSGAATADSRTVTLNSTYNSVFSAPTQYMASESSTFAGATWLTWAASVPFTLSAGNVNKTVYFRVKNSIGQISATVSDTILLQEATTLPFSINWTSTAISPVGDMDWFQFTVTTPGRYVIETWIGALTKDDLRLYGPNSRTLQIASDNGANGARMARLELNLATAGTYYIRCSAYNWLYDSGSYWIRLYPLVPPAIRSYGINNGAIFTTTRTVVLNNAVFNPGSTMANTPTEYLASENLAFTGAVWKPYSGAPKYTISGAGDGLKAVYLKLRNSAGESIGWVDTINLTSIQLKAMIVYASSSNQSVANDLYTFLKSRGIASALVPMSAVTQTDPAPFQVIIICNDTGSLNTWGTAAQISWLNQSGKPVLGLGEGGYAYFGKLALNIGYGNGAHGSETTLVEADNTHSVFNMPHNLATANPRMIGVYAAATSTVGIYMPTVPANVVMLGTEASASTYSPLACEFAHFTLWGYTGAPSAMTAAGKDLFENVVRFTAGLGTW